MRARLVAVFGLLLLAGCACQEPKLSIEASVLDSIPVVPLVTVLGVSTAWLDGDLSLVTVSHAIPRGQSSGPAEVSWTSVIYTVTASGDGLEREWALWDSTIARLGQGQDWAKMRLTLPLTQGSFFTDPLTITWSDQPPRVGEQLVIVGYTREDNQVVRYWTPIEIIDVPEVHREIDAGHHVWFRTVTGKNLREGFSGAPLLRQRVDGGFEACAMMVSAQYKRGGEPLSTGVAIVVPKD